MTRAPFWPRSSAVLLSGLKFCFDFCVTLNDLYNISLSPFSRGGIGVGTLRRKVINRISSALIVVLFLLLNFIRRGGLGGWGVSAEIKRELSKVFLPSAMWVLGIQLRVPHLTAAPLPTKLPHQYLLFLILIFLL